MALYGLEEVVQQLADLDEQYQARRKELLQERNELVRDAAECKVSIRKLQYLTGLSRSRLYQVRAGGSDD